MLKKPGSVHGVPVMYLDDGPALGSKVTNVGCPEPAKSAVQWPAVTNVRGESNVPEQNSSPELAIPT
jgi:hypothetical protein